MNISSEGCFPAADESSRSDSWNGQDEFLRSAANGVNTLQSFGSQPLCLTRNLETLPSGATCSYVRLAWRLSTTAEGLERFLGRDGRYWTGFALNDSVQTIRSPDFGSATRNSSAVSNPVNPVQVKDSSVVPRSRRLLFTPSTHDLLVKSARRVQNSCPHKSTLNQRFLGHTQYFRCTRSVRKSSCISDPDTGS